MEIKINRFLEWNEHVGICIEIVLVRVFYEGIS